MIGALAAAAAAAAAGASARWNWWRPVVAGGLPVLMYHKIGEPPPGSELKKLWVSPEKFRAQLGYLRENGYETVSFSRWRDAEKGLNPLPEKPVLITFDDGYADNHANAYPLLREFGMKGGVFLVYETVDRHNAWHDPATEPWQKMLSWAQVKEMQDSGVFEFGSHTMRHRCLTDIPLEDARWEAAESKRRLEEKLGREVVAFAYPYGAGAYDAAVRGAARDAGYRFD
ncbi:MAG: polysaccharide deacetylase family protein, partial [Elusimicrobia bacterium]|nr:polysaccharide deacetylase family protein [Elusimicrobiota bacterium]